jgi:hypothetical protein
MRKWSIHGDRYFWKENDDFVRKDSAILIVKADAPDYSSWVTADDSVLWHILNNISQHAV